MHLLAVALCLFYSIALCSQNQSPSAPDSIQRIAEIIVTASSLKHDLMPTQQLSGISLSKLNAYSVADALRYFSGLQIKDYGGIGGLKTVDVRSLGSQHLGVFYNGIAVGNAQNGVVDLGRFSLDNMELVRLFNGQKGSALQSARDYASSNTLYLQSRRPKFNSLGSRHEFRCALDVGSFLTINPKASWGYKVNETSTLSVSGETVYSSGRYPFRYKRVGGYDVSAIRENGDISALRSELTWWGTLFDGVISSHAYIYHSERGYPGASVREEPGLFKNQDRQWDTNLFLQNSFKLEKTKYQLQVLAKYAYDYLRYLSDPRLDVSTMHVDNRYYQQELYASVGQVFHLNSKYILSLSNDLQYNILKANLPEFVYPQRLQTLTALASSYRGKRLRVQGSLLHTYVLDLRERAPKRQTEMLWSPTLHLVYRPLAQRGLSIKAFYKHSYRLPTLNDLYYDFLGETRLRPEKTEQWNLGILYEKQLTRSPLSNYELQINAYYNRVQDKIVAMPTSNQFRWTMLNYGLVNILGVDITMMGQFILGRLHLSPRLTYTYQKAKEHSDHQSPWYGGQIPYAPQHAGSVILGITYNDWFTNYSFLYTGERYHSIANIEEYYIQPWYTHDVSLGKTWFWGNKTLAKTIIEVNNLLNQQYEVVRNYPMPGINFKLKLQLYV